jgi:hypothetical protein
MKRRYWLICLALVGGCGGSASQDAREPADLGVSDGSAPASDSSLPIADGSAPASDGSAPASDGAGPAADMVGAGGPAIITFGTNVTQLTVGESVRFVALVTDPKGLDQLVGGRLVDPTGTIQYGAFQATTQSSYELDLSWSEINQAAPITFDAQELRTFRADFFDLSKQSATQSVQIRLQCNGIGACAGVCTDLQNDAKNCGTCGTTVALPRICVAGEAACAGGNSYCPVQNACTNLMSDPNNCGVCGQRAGNWATCNGGVITCLISSWTWCPAQNTCADLSSDSKNCGACGAAVPLNEFCINGMPVCQNPLVCGGVCTPQSVTDCGACGKTCPLVDGMVAACLGNGQCEYGIDQSTPITCASLCGTKGMQCDSGQGTASFYGTSTVAVWDPSCSTVPAASRNGDDFDHVHCTCM